MCNCCCCCCCGGGSDKGGPVDVKRTRAIDTAFIREQHQASQIHKLLLLGAGQSGKSTLFKQMQIIYGQGFDDDDKKEFREIIHNNAVIAIKTLCEQSDELAERGIANTGVNPRLGPNKQYILDMPETTVISMDVAKNFWALWKDPGVQMTYRHRSMYQLEDSAAYYLEKVLELGRDDWLPDTNDILRARVRTTGIVENTYNIDGSTFKMFDVGGQRNERKKWIHCFSDVTAVLFVAALSAYDLTLFEDEETNRMDEALDLFDEICNSRWFRKTSMILMLNKSDLFKVKVKEVPLSEYFPAYTGPNEFEPAANFINEQFKMRLKDTKKQIYSHFTCATDSKLMRTIFNATKTIIIRRSLEDGGLLPEYS